MRSLITKDSYLNWTSKYNVFCNPFSFSCPQEMKILSSQNKRHSNPTVSNLSTPLKESLVIESASPPSPTARMSLFQQKVNKTRMFRTYHWMSKDMLELIGLLRDSPGVFCRPSKVKSMIASRACRSSIMIGQSLSLPSMHQILSQMNGLQSPWNCPHGRPTMRHLHSLRNPDIANFG